MSRMKKRNLQRLIAVYLTSSVLLSGAVCDAAMSGTYYAADEGQTEVTVVEGGNLDEVNEIYGGSNVYDGGGISNITSTGIIVDANGGDVGSITGGSAAEDGVTAHVGTVNITMRGGDVSYIVGGGEACTDGATSTVDTVNIHISGGGLNEEPFQIDGEPDTYNGLVGGGLAWGADDESGTNTANVKNVNITITGGTFYAGEPGTAIWGGGVAIDDGSRKGVGSKAVAHVDTVNMNISGGSIATDIYAGGYADGDDAESTVDNATVNISGGAIDGSVYAGGMGSATVGNSTINVSGGSISGDISADDNVTGNSALNFISGGTSTVGGDISGFDVVNVTSGAQTKLEGAALEAKAFNIAEGGKATITNDMTIDLDQTARASFKLLRAPRAANGVLNLAGELIIQAGTTLTLSNATVVSQNTGMFTVGVNGADVGQVDASGAAFTDGNGTANKVNVNIALPLDVINNMSGDEINSILGTALGAAAASLDIGNGLKAEYSYRKDSNGNIIGVKANESLFSVYTGVRQANAHIAQNMTENVHERGMALRSGEHGNDFWVNIRGGQTDIDNQYGETEVKSQYYQLGYDWDVSSSDNKAAVGLYFSKIYGDITQSGVKSDIDNAYDFGIYGMKEFGNGVYLDLIGRYGQTKNVANINDRVVDWKDKGYGLSAEFGKRIAQKDDWMLEPYMQLSYNRMSDANLHTGLTAISLDDANLLDGRIGLRFIKQEQDNQNDNIYAGISYARGLSGDFKVSTQSGMKITEVDNDANSFELALGMNRQISPCSTVNLNAKKEFGDYEGWSLQGMLNVKF